MQAVPMHLYEVNLRLDLTLEGRDPEAPVFFTYSFLIRGEDDHSALLDAERYLLRQAKAQLHGMKGAPLNVLILDEAGGDLFPEWPREIGRKVKFFHSRQVGNA